MNSSARNPMQADQSARSAALDPAQSFIVQAPAGSGKTELLIQRLLAVLAQAEHPSEVLAITFTNKAAGEMRERLYNALRSAQLPADASLRPVEQVRRALAQAVLQRDAARGWKLMDRPDAVLIDTFDAFCARLAARAPLQQVAASAALAPIEPSLNAAYREAARTALFDDDIRRESTLLLTLAANRVDDVVALIADLLARRAQWLGEAVDTSDAAVARLTAVLVAQVEKHIEQVAGLHNHRLDAEITALAQFTATVFSLDGRRSQAAERDALAEAWPVRAELSDLSHWQTLSDLLLTASGELRKPGGINVKAGFPIPKDAKYADIAADERAAMKARMQAILPVLERDTAFVSALAKTRTLPAALAISEHEIALKATLVVLKLSAAYLSVLLRERGVTDFSGVMIAALSGLRDAREDVLAGLDAKLKHILVDEVQDTNPAQFDLLRMLTEDWSSGDGRTLFLVGDPMQSIYGFRDADVSLFLQAQAHGVGEVALTPLTLTANYRSQPVVVDWVNQEIARVFSSDEGASMDDESRVQFVSAFATRTAGTLRERVAHRAFSNDADEANAIAESIAEIRTEEPEASVAVLVRGRAHATALIAQFAARNIAFSAREFADWSARETVRDLLSLTYAIAQPSDRLSLFSVLRSPWVGCTLATLAAFANALDGASAYAPDDGLPARTRPSLAPAAHLLRADQAWVAGVVDSDERARIAHAAAAFAIADAHAWMSSLAERVEAAWRALAGPALLANEAACDEADAFFSWLSRVSAGGALPPRHELELLLNSERQSFSSSAAADPKAESGTVEILTIHKAKGLEWDHVFLIGADRPVRGDARALAQWRFVASDSTNAKSNRAVLIAARDSRRRSEGSVFDFVSDQTRSAREDEGKRLLYVAATRARRTLTLSRTSAHKPPSPGSFAQMLGLQADESLNVDNAPTSRRLLLESSLKRSTPPVAFGLETIVWPAYRATLDVADTTVPVENRDARAQGIVGHLLFEGLAAMHSRGAAFSPNVAATERKLLEEGASIESARAFAERVVAWFSTASTRANVQFLFNATHLRRNTEWSLPGAPDDATQMRVDYTFVTAENVRWVIDFKFAEPGAGVDQSAWRAAQLAQYRAQLLSYVARVRALDASSSQVSDGATPADRPIRAALYFPWIDCLEEMKI
jgi:ATP-dependent exoDNAse (exonuclease V) beta subunit